MPECCELAAVLSPRGYVVFKLAPGAPYCCISFANDHTEKIAPGWVASFNSVSGFTEHEARVVANDRGGSLL